MKIKYDDLMKAMKKLEKHSKKGNIEISFDPMAIAVVVSYVSNIDTETTLTIYDSDLNKFVTINEKKWLD
jgi:hypothetical protein